MDEQRSSSGLIQAQSEITMQIDILIPVWAALYSR